MDDLKLYQIFLIFRWNSGGIMPKKRKQPGTRNFEKRIFILCEGSDKHSEYAYFTSLLRDYFSPNRKKYREGVSIRSSRKIKIRV